MEHGKLKKILDILPHKPGVYLFKDESGKIIYVGKAKDINKRVRSYFTPKKDQDLPVSRINVFFHRVKKIDYIVTDNEVEALVLESSLIKKNHPRYNVDLKDDKSYPFMVITENEKYPRLFLTRNRNIRGARYFGPYTNVRPAKNVLETLRKSFKVRDCRQPRPGKNNQGPCLNYHINLCSAPCIGKISEKEYRQNIEYISMFLKGKSSIVADRILKDMERHSENQEFEKAAELKNILNNIQSIYQQQKIMLQSGKIWDVLGVCKQGGSAAISFFSYREGELAVVNNFLISNTQYMGYSDIISGFITRYYEGINNMPTTIYVPRDFEGMEALMGWLKGQKGKNIKIKVPRRGEKKKIMDMASRNARLYMEKKNSKRTADTASCTMNC
ncbi:MAG: excinuclease ABC subunit UvrC [Actinomycetota bacterium]|nr:excinuclease ABC subunit UvrC [Actinomycetota bacterium]